MKRRAFLLSGLAAAGCAPTVQSARSPLLGFRGPRFTGDRFVSFDGMPLGLSRWEADEPWAVIVGLHGMNDYGNAYHMAGPWWAAQGITTYAYDQRGFGRSPYRGVWPGTRLMVEDLRTAVQLARERHPNAIVAVAGESMGGAVAIAAFGSDNPPAADRLVLLAPAVWGWSSQPLPYRMMLWLTAHVAGSSVIEPPSWLTSRIRASDNIEELIRMGRDRQMIWGARNDALYGLVQLMETAYTRISEVRAPTAYLYGANDQIIPPEPSFEAAARLSRGRTAYYPEGWHLLTRDLQAERVWADVAAFIRDPAAPFPSRVGGIPRGQGADTRVSGL